MFLFRGEPGKAHALVNILQQDQNAVSEGRVEPMPFLGPRGEEELFPSMQRHLAESEGFEPPSPCGLAVFKTAAFDRSANSP